MTGEKRRAQAALCLTVLICLLFGSVFLFCSINTGDYIDDYGYRYMFSREEKLTDNRVDSLAEVVQSQYEHYYIMNGRTVPHTLLQFFLMFDNVVFDIANAVMYVLLALGMYTLARSAKRRGAVQQPALLLAMFLLPWIFFSDFGNVMFIACIAVNYLWSMTFVVWALVPFARLYCGHDVFGSCRAAGTVVMALGCTAAGWCSENGSAAMLFAIGCMGLYYLIAKKPIPAWCISGFAGGVAGFAAMMLAPGYDVRVEHETSGGQLGVVDRFMRLVSAHTMIPYGALIFITLAALGCCIFLAKQRERREVIKFVSIAVALCAVTATVHGVLYDHVRSAWAALAMCALAFAACVVLLVKMRGSLGELKSLVFPMMLVLTGFVATFALIAVPYVQVRSQLPFMVLFGTGAVVIMARAIKLVRESLAIEKKRAGHIYHAALAAALVYCVVSLGSVAVQTQRQNDEYIAIHRAIEQQKQAGVQTVVMPPLPEPKDRRVACRNMISSAPGYWINQAFCQYYDIEAVQWEVTDEQ